MSVFKSLISSMIDQNGYVSMHVLMSLWSRYYYLNKESVIGTNGDFITAPEISQMFGEIVAVWILDNYKKFQAPFSLMELGPGKGTFMNDILRVCMKYDDFRRNLQDVILVEFSEKMREHQKKKLAEHNVSIRWIDDISGLSPQNLLVVTNEFLDSLPIMQQVSRNGKICEVAVSKQDDKFCLVLVSSDKELVLESDSVHESSPQQIKYIEKLSKHKMMGLFIDYGYLHRTKKSSVQVVKNHQKVSMLDNIGDGDITALVDFGAIISKANQLGMRHKFQTQREFLCEHGIELRAQNLIDQHVLDRAKIQGQLDRLISPEQMGELFKVLQLSNV